MTFNESEGTVSRGRDFHCDSPLNDSCSKASKADANTVKTPRSLSPKFSQLTHPEQSGILGRGVHITEGER